MKRMVDSLAPATRGELRAFLRYGFRLAFAYCCLGIAVELLRPLGTEWLYHQLARFIYGVPLGLLSLAELAEPLAAVSVEGRLGRFLAAAAAPAIGVLSIFVVTLVAFGATSLFRIVLSLKQRA